MYFNKIVKIEIMNKIMTGLQNLLNRNINSKNILIGW